MPVLNGFTRVRQHGGPVLSARAFSIAAYTAHPNHLIMANTDGDRLNKKTQSALGGELENGDKGGPREIPIAKLLREIWKGKGPDKMREQ